MPIAIQRDLGTRCSSNRVLCDLRGQFWFLSVFGRRIEYELLNPDFEYEFFWSIPLMGEKKASNEVRAAYAFARPDLLAWGTPAHWVLTAWCTNPRSPKPISFDPDPIFLDDPDDPSEERAPQTERTVEFAVERIRKFQNEQYREFEPFTPPALSPKQRARLLDALQDLREGSANDKEASRPYLPVIARTLFCLCQFEEAARSFDSLAKLGLVLRNPITEQEEREWQWLLCFHRCLCLKQAGRRSRVDGSDRLRLTYPPLSAERPHISPDGSQVSFDGEIDEHGTYGYVVSMQGGKARKVFENGGISVWSPDGKSLAYAAILPGPSNPATSELRTIDLESGKVSVVPDGRNRIPIAWPKAETLVASENSSLKLMALDFQNQKWRGLLEQDCASLPAPSVDGKYIYCEVAAEPHHKVIRVRIDDGSVEPVIEIKGVRRLSGEDFTLGVAPGGSVLLTRDAGTSEIYALTIKWP